MTDLTVPIWLCVLIITPFVVSIACNLFVIYQNRRRMRWMDRAGRNSELAYDLAKRSNELKRDLSRLIVNIDGDEAAEREREELLVSPGVRPHDPIGRG